MCVFTKGEWRLKQSKKYIHFNNASPISRENMKVSITKPNGSEDSGDKVEAAHVLGPGILSPRLHYCHRPFRNLIFEFKAIGFI